jgi:D-aminoacyl-tRNA deacylase
MVYLIYSKETASSNIAGHLKQILGMEDEEEFHGMKHFSYGKMKMLEVEGRLIDSDFLNDIISDDIIFLSRHSSSKGIAAFTVHAEGNWSDDNSLGGKPKELSVSSPSRMIDVICAISKINTAGIQTVYEATHHGPLLDRPSFFVELGGNESVINSKDYAEIIANAVANSIDDHKEYDKVAIGLGGMHYSDKFTKLSFEGKYAFAHIMPKYRIDCIDMIKTAIERTDRKVEIVLVEWKSIKAAEREIIVRELNVLGIDYAKV